MCNEVMRTMPHSFHRIHDGSKTQEMCIKAVEVDPSFLELIPNHFKTQEIYDKAGKEDSSYLQYGPDWFVTRKWMCMWYDDYYQDDGVHWDDDNDEDKFFELYDGHKKRKAHKTSIKEELFPISWHPDREMGWCMSGEEKKLWK